MYNLISDFFKNPGIPLVQAVSASMDNIYIY